MTDNYKEVLLREGFIHLSIEVPKEIRDFALNYEIPKSSDRLPDQIELNYRYVDENFKYLEELKDLIKKAIKYDKDLSEKIDNVNEVIVQELKSFELLEWHHDKYMFDDNKPLLFEALLYISNVDEPKRWFFYKPYDESEEDISELNSGAYRLSNGSIVLIDCTSDKYVHSAFGPDLDQKVVTFLLGCR